MAENVNNAEPQKLSLNIVILLDKILLICSMGIPKIAQETNKYSNTDYIGLERLW